MNFKIYMKEQLNMQNQCQQTQSFKLDPTLKKMLLEKSDKGSKNAFFVGR